MIDLNKEIKTNKHLRSIFYSKIDLNNFNHSINLKLMCIKIALSKSLEKL